MKKFPSILSVTAIMLLALAVSLHAQTYSGGAGPVNWDDPTTWGIPDYFPGLPANDNNVATINPTAAVTFNNCTPPNRVRALNILGAVGVTLNGNGTLRIGALRIQNNITLTIGGSLNVIIDSVLEGNPAASISLNPGCTLTMNAKAPNSLDLGPRIAAGSSNVSSVVIGPDANGGIYPADAITNTYTGSVIINGNTKLSVNHTRPANAGPLVLNANITVLAGATLTLAQTAIGSLVGSGKIGAEGGTVVLRGTLAAPYNFGILPAQNFASPFTGTLQIGDATGNGQILVVSGGDLTIGKANPTSTIEQGIVALQTSILRAGAGTTITLNGTLPTAITQLVPAQRGFVTATTGGVLVLGPGFSNGFIPVGGIASIGGELRTSGPLSIALPGITIGMGGITDFGNVSLLVTSGSISLGGDLTLTGSGTLNFANTQPNTLKSPSGARIIATNPQQFIRFLPAANGGIIPGKFFANPWLGGWYIGSPITLQDSLNFSPNAGQIYFASWGSVFTIGPNAVVSLNQTAAGTIQNIPVAGAMGTPPMHAIGISYSSYFQGVGASSVLELGVGFNGGNIPSAGYTTGAAAPNNVNVAFLPRPVFPANTDGTYRAGFNGRLVLKGTLQCNRDIQIGPNGVLDLQGGNLVMQNRRFLQLFNQAPNSLTGSGFIQCTAPPTGALPYVPGGVGYVPFPHVHTLDCGSSVMIGPGMNGGILPAARFANPFTGIMDVSSAGTITVQGDLTIGIVGQGSFFVIGGSRVGYDDPTAINPAGLASGALGGAGLPQRPENACVVTIAPNSSVTLNGVHHCSLWGSPRSSPPGPNLPGTFQGSGSSSRLVIGPGHGRNHINGTAQIFDVVNLFDIPALNGQPYALTTNGNFVSSPFNGQLVFEGPSIICTSLTIGVNGGITLNAPVALATNTTYMIPQELRVTPPPPPHRFLSNGPGLTLTINGQGPNALIGPGFIQANTSNTIVLGSGFNGGVIDGSKFANPYRGTLATVSAMTLTGTLSIGASTNLRQDNYTEDGLYPGNRILSSGFLRLGGDLTISDGAFLIVSNATAPALTGTGKIQAVGTGELRFVDFYANGAGPFYNNLSATSISGIAQLDASVLASPFNGRLVIGRGGLSPRNSLFILTNGTITIG
ncbi:MAG: hypothetical protein RML40_11485, partial [Bacteroidota bacterium]|nr:hypothetical protein [Candidatus Kapabacteria bacterium]MDW8221138.1 hypothetical protein [Bacteroidota bacterium]